MPMVRDERAIAAGASSGNIMVNTLYQYIPGRPAVVKVFAVEDGGTASTVKMDVICGNTQELLAGVVSKYTAGEGPDTNKHMICEAVAAAGDQLIVSIANTGALTSNTRTLVKIDFM